MVGGAVAIYDLANITSQLGSLGDDDFGIEASAGIGLYLCAGGAITAVSVAMIAQGNPPITGRR